MLGKSGCLGQQVMGHPEHRMPCCVCPDGLCRQEVVSPIANTRYARWRPSPSLRRDPKSQAESPNIIYEVSSLPEGEPRYKLPKKFNKSLELFNLHRATALGIAFVVIVEGFWPAIRLHMLGIPAVAVMGSHARSTQLDLIVEAGFTHAYIIMDGDEAGRFGAEKAVNDLAGRIFVRRIDLPEGVKPDTMGQEWIDQLV